MAKIGAGLALAGMAMALTCGGVAHAQTERITWNLEAIEAEAAWRKSLGEGVVVAVVESGIQSTHPDLAPNMWVNSGEIANNGEDDDFNGYVDDIHGWDFHNNAPAVNDNEYHGSHIAGIIAGVSSRRFSGVAPRARLMSVPFLDQTGIGTEENAARAIVYATDMGAKIIHCGWYFPGQSQTIESAIGYALSRGVLIVAAAGDEQRNNDVNYVTPASSNFLNVITVGASSNRNGAKADFSNTGRTTVELAAPGRDIRSVNARGGYIRLNGTSMAAAHVAGVAALIWSKNPVYSWSDVRRVLLTSSPAVRGWRNLSATQGVINARQAVR